MSFLNLPEIPVFVIYLIFFIDFYVFFVFFMYFIRTKIYAKKAEKPKKYSEISFIIPAYNVSKTLADSVQSIKKSNYPQDKIKVIIVDDGSNDNTLNTARALSKRFRGISVFSKKNSGKADSLNYGLKKAKTELVAVLDADTLLKKDLLEKSVAKFNNENIAAVTARFKPRTTGTYWERMQQVEYSLASFKRHLMESVSSLPIAPAFTIFRREFFLKHEYFDTGNITEDFEMGLRIQHKGYGMGFVNDSYALTSVPDSFRKLFRQRLRWNYGTLYNYGKYKEMFFNISYGDLGAFVFPFWILGLFLSSIIFLLSIYSFFAYSLKYVWLFKMGWIPSFNSNIDILVFNLTQLSVLLFLASLLLAIVSFFLIKFEVDREAKFWNYAVMLFSFLWFLGVFYLIGLIYFALGRKPKW